MSDRHIQVATAAAVALVATIAAVVSYSHLYSLALTHGETRLDARLLPLSIDGTVVTASLLMLRAHRQGLGTPWLARTMLVAAVAMTVAANVAFGWSYAFWGIAMAGWPAAAFLGNAEAVLGFGRKAAGSGTDRNMRATALFDDRLSAAKIAYERSVMGGNPFTANALVQRFALTRPEAAEIVKAALVASNGHGETAPAQQ